MNGNLGLNAIPGRSTKKLGVVKRHYLNTCPYCKLGVYADEDRTRMRRPYTGLVHTEHVPEGAQ